jgi:hypothetical protein
MILVGSQRGGAANLAAHLLNRLDNDHVTVHELRGFVADTLHGALAEAHAISRATKATQFLFSLSLNPPKDAEVRLDALLDAAERAEAALGLNGRPRAIIIHEKQGRRHAHVVWSRIKAQDMKAVNLPFFKTRLKALSKELYLEHGWQLPEGHKTNGWKNPLNFSMAEWQQARRIGLDPREVKQVFQSAFARSDNLASFRAALEESGYFLAKGDRRGFVASDLEGEVFSVARWAGIKTKDLNARLGNPDRLPDVETVQKSLRARMTERLRDFVREDRKSQEAEQKPLTDELNTMVSAHRRERARLQTRQAERWKDETSARQARFRKGLGALYDLLTGKAAALRRDNERETFRAWQRDRAQRERLFEDQMRERSKLQLRLDAIGKTHRQDRQRLTRRIMAVLRPQDRQPPGHGRARQRGGDLEHGL